MTSRANTGDHAALTHAEAMSLQAAELQRLIAVLAELSPDEWTARTECPAWDVRQMHLHVLGACESAASMRELVHQMLAARRLQKAEGGPLEAALSAVQVRERDSLTPTDLLREMRRVAPIAVRKRTAMPGLVRRGVRMKVDGPVVERWSLGYLVDTIYLRDVWMHRIDTCRAVGRAPELTADHDGRIVADVVAEWARRHGQAFRLQLTGAAGGTFAASGTSGREPGADGVTLTLDAVEFCRTLAGREPGEGLLATIVPF